MRISKDDYYLGIARAVSKRSTCLRRQYGAVIVKNDRIISTGYNGSARGEPNCCDIGTCWREEHNIPHGERYEHCKSLHAEDNAISQAGRETIGATLYLAGFENGVEIIAEPCMMCERKIKNAQIERVITKNKISSTESLHGAQISPCSCGHTPHLLFEEGVGTLVRCYHCYKSTYYYFKDPTDAIKYWNESVVTSNEKV